MSGKHIAADQPSDFHWSPDYRAQVDWWLAKYPAGRKRSAVIPLLWLAQKQDGWISEAAMQAIGSELDMARIRVLEVATFYSMFNLAPVGQYFVQMCGTTPCWLRGSDAIKEVCEKEIGEAGQVSADGKFSWIEVECLGACCNAPMVQINDDYFEDLTAENFRTLLADLRDGKPVKVGPQNSRRSSEPQGGATTLKSTTLYDGSAARPIRTLPNCEPVKA
jgi:NADH-quinone oxidoreductase subunit E